MIKKIILAGALLFAPFLKAQATTFIGVNMSTSGALQAGTSNYAMHIGSGTVDNFRASTVTVTGSLAVSGTQTDTGTANFNGPVNYTGSTVTFAGSTVTATSGTKNWLPGSLIISSATFLVNQSSGSTAATFIISAMPITITPPAGVNILVKLQADFPISNSSWAADSCYSTIKKNGTDMSSGTRGMKEYSGEGAGAAVSPETLTWQERVTPATGASITYSLSVRNSAASVTCTIGTGNAHSIFQVDVYVAPN